MTGYRQSMVFALEDEFAKGPGTKEEGGATVQKNKWISPPPGTHFESTQSRNVSLYTAMGTKTWEVATYGQFQGQWSWTTILDYDYPEFLCLVFDDYHYDTSTKTHIFRKCNAKRVKSFCVRRKILNRVAGGPDGSDETTILKGCVVTDVSFSRSAGNGSQIQVRINGLYANEEMDNTSLDATDYSAYNGDPVEYACLFSGDTSGEHIEYVDQLSINISNGASGIYGICTPFALNYAEGPSNYGITISAYSNDPKRFKKRVYSGGRENRATRPWAKDMRPMEKMTVISYNKSRYNEEFTTEGEPYLPYENMAEAIAGSDKIYTFTLEQIIVKSMTWQSGDGSKLMDQVSGTNARRVTLKLKNSDEKYQKAIDLTTGGGHPLRVDGTIYNPCDVESGA